MQDLPQLSTQLGGLQKGADTTQQMLRLMDDISGNFSSALANAEDKESAKSTVTAKKAPHKAEKKDEAAPKEASAEASEENVEASGEEAPANATVVEESAEEAAAPVAEVPEETEELAVETAGISEVSEEEAAEALAEADLVEEGSEAADVELEEGVTPEAPTQEDTALAEVSVVEQASVEAPDLEEAPKAVAAVDAQQAVEQVAQTDAELNAVESEEEHRRVHSQAKAPVVEASAEQTQSDEADNEQDTVKLKDFHNIKPEKAEVMTDKAEAAKVQAGLEQVAAQTQVQAPKVETVSAKVMDGIKSVSPSMAKGLESSSKPASSPYAALAKGATAKANNSNLSDVKAAEKPAGTEMERRISDMKAKVIEQIRFKVKMAMKGKVGQIKLQLNPKFLGNVKIQINMEDSAMRANFLVDNQSVKDLLTRSAPTLQSALQEQGIDLSELEVSVANEGTGDGENGRAFASAEDQKAMKEWLGSFYRFGPESDLLNGSEDKQEEAAIGDSDQVLNVMA